MIAQGGLGESWKEGVNWKDLNEGKDPDYSIVHLRTDLITNTEDTPGVNNETLPHQKLDLAEGSQVEYWSKSLDTWLPAVVKRVDPDTGKVEIDLKKDKWLTHQEIVERLRARSRPDKAQMQWIRAMIFEDRVDEEAVALFHQYASKGQDVLSKDFRDLANDMDSKLGISGTVCLLMGYNVDGLSRTRTEEKEPSQSISRDKFREMFWDLTWAVHREFCQAAALPQEVLQGVQRHESRGLKAFSIEQKIGRGNFGSVMLARDKATGALRAIKQIECFGLRKVIDEEVEIITRLDHPHVVRLHEFFEEGRTFYLVMDFCSGGDLEELLAQQRKAEQQLGSLWIATVMHQIVGAIAHCHARGVLHLDLKPGNIMLLPGRGCQSTLPPGGDGATAAAEVLANALGWQPNAKAMVLQSPHAMIIDLGVAQIFRAGDSRARRVSGTPACMAPEVWSGESNPKSDIFSLAVVFFRMSTLEWPFLRMPADNLEAGQFWDASPKPAWSKMAHRTEQASNLCTTMMDRKAQLRPTAQQCLRHPYFTEAGIVPEMTPRFGKDGPGPKEASFHELKVPPKLLTLLANAHNRSILHKRVSHAIARDWPPNRMPTLCEIFKFLDTADTGRLRRDRIADMLHQLGGMDLKLALEAADSMDLSRDGRVDWSEFVAACIDLSDSRFEPRIMQTFNSADRDGDGLLSQEDICRLAGSDEKSFFAVQDLFLHLVGRTESGARMDWHTFHRHICKACPGAEGSVSSWRGADANSIRRVLDGFVAEASGLFDSAAGFFQQLTNAEPDEEKVQRLLSMGFTDQQRIRQALRRAGNNIQLAVNELVQS